MQKCEGGRRSTHVGWRHAQIADGGSCTQRAGGNRTKSSAGRPRGSREGDGEHRAGAALWHRDFVRGRGAAVLFRHSNSVVACTVVRAGGQQRQWRRSAATSLALSSCRAVAAAACGRWSAAIGSSSSSSSSSSSNRSFERSAAVGSSRAARRTRGEGTVEVAKAWVGPRHKLGPADCYPRIKRLAAAPLPHKTAQAAAHACGRRAVRQPGWMERRRAGAERCMCCPSACRPAAAAAAAAASPSSPARGALQHSAPRLPAPLQTTDARHRRRPPPCPPAKRGGGGVRQHRVQVVVEQGLQRRPHFNVPKLQRYLKAPRPHVVPVLAERRGKSGQPVGVMHRQEAAARDVVQP